MQITATDTSTLSFALVQNNEVTQRVFSTLDTINSVDVTHTVLVHIDKQQNDVDGDGTIDTLDAKFNLTLINTDGTPELLNNKEVKISQVHSISVESLSDGTTDIIDWISDISVQLIPVVVNKKTTLASWAGI